MVDHPFSAELYIDGAWEDVTTDVRQGSAVKVTKGGGEITKAPKPSTLALTFNDQDGTYRPDRAMSPLYGKIGRNTPIAVPGGVFEVSAWNPDKTVDHGTGKGDQTTDISASGTLGRVGSWKTQVASALSQTIPSEYGPNLIGHWRLEDRDRAQYPKPEVGQLARPSQNFNFKFGNTDVPAGANTSAQVSSNSAITGKFLPASASAGWQVGFMFKLARQPADTLYSRILYLSTPDYTWQIWINDTNYRMYVFNRDNGDIEEATDAAYSGAGFPTSWIYMTLKTTPSGGSTNWVLEWYVLGDDVTFSTSGTVAFPPGQLLEWQYSGNPAVEGALYSHLFAVTGVTDNLVNGTMLAAYNGWPDESTTDRFVRLMDLNNLPWTIEGSTDRARLMGAQHPGTLLEQLREIRDTEGGVIYDDPDALGITFRTAEDLLTQTPALALTFGTDVAPPFLPVLDDLDAYNLITVSNYAGGSATVEDETSPMGTQNPPDGIGEYKLDIDVNLNADRPLFQRAVFELAAGTVQDARYKSVTIDLDANPTLATACEALKPGDRVTVTGADPDVIDLMVVSITDVRTTRYRRMVTLVCKPYRVYNAGVWDDTDSRWDSNATTLLQSALSTNRSLIFSTAQANTTWYLGAGYDVHIAGERVSVTWMSRAGSIQILDGSFESGVTGWATTGGSMSSSTAQAHTGTKSCLVTVSGSPTQSYIRPSSAQICAPNTSYTTRHWVRCSIAGTVYSAVDWYNGSGTYVSTTGSSTVLAANTWTELVVTHTSPGTAASCRHGPTLTGSPANGTLLYVDDIDLHLTTPTVPYRQNSYVTRGVNGVTKDLAAGDEIHVSTPGRWAL